MQYLEKKRDRFYYLVCTDLQTQRDNKLSVLFDEDFSISFLSQYTKYKFDTVTEIHLARFWKDKDAALRVANHHKKIQEQKGHSVIFDLQSMNRKEFINSIPELKIDDYVYLKNIKIKKSEMEYLEDVNEFRSAYKAISAYQQVDKPFYWLNCPNCGLKPLIWTYDNGRSTACGCGENEYRHQ